MLILFGLAILWAAVLVPPLVRNRDILLRPAAAVAGATKPLGRSVPHRLKKAGFAATSVPSNVGSARRRRRDLLLILTGLAVFTFLGGLAVGGVAWMAHFLVDLVLVGYAVLVTQRHQIELERRETVIPFRADGPLMGGIGGSVAMRDEAVLSRRAN